MGAVVLSAVITERKMGRAVRRRMHDGKVRYQDKGAAVLAIKHVDRDMTLHSYKCRFCRGWHIGHLPKALRRTIESRYEW